MNTFSLQPIVAAVQENCDRVDARYATRYGLCTYLLKMREYYRWEKGRPYGESLSNDAVGDWVTAREARWDGLDGEIFSPIRIDGARYDPFDSEAINAALLPKGLIYGGGIGHAAHPHFFLAELEREERQKGCRLLVAGRELARDLAAPPAMSREGVIYVRRESLRRMLWERFENWRWSRPDSALGRAFAAYPFERDLDLALDAMTEAEMETVIRHERGEHRAGEILGEHWNGMLMALAGTPAELMARAVRDHWADCAETIPALIDLDRPASLHFFIGNLGGMRKELFPALVDGYRRWHQGGSLEELRDLAGKGEGHWSGLARRMVEIFVSQPDELAREIAELAMAEVLRMED